MESRRRTPPGEPDLADNNQRCYPAGERLAASKVRLQEAIVEDTSSSADEIAGRMARSFATGRCIRKEGTSMNTLK